MKKILSFLLTFAMLISCVGIVNVSADAEYIYHGTCNVIEGLIYVFLKNDFSEERANLFLIKSAGNLNRFIGLFTALSSNMTPVCIKVACFREELLCKGINEELLKKIITSSNITWENNMLIIEETQKYLFFSDEILT